MALSLEQIVKQLEDSGIIASETLKDFIPPKADPKTPEELVQALVKSDKLTTFQAQHVNAGKVKSLILGSYTIINKIGAGGMGQVFKAEHRRMKRIVAIKMLPPAMTKDAAALARFQREVEAAAKLNHTNIVTAYDADQANGAHFLVMEYVEGKDLSAQVKKNGPFPVSKAVNYVLQAAKGLEFAHKKGVIHRDIKPANLLLDSDGTVKILDMGLARIESDGGPAQAELTGTGTIMGTVDYMAPEQGMSTKYADARADIYSLGCSLYYLIAGKATYDGETVAAKLVAHHTHPIPSLQEAHPEIPDQLEAVFKKMVAKKIENRYQTMTEVVAELEKCQAAVTAAASGSTSVWKAPASYDQSSDMSLLMQNQKLARIDNRDDPFAVPEPEKKKPRQSKTKTKSKADAKSKLSRPVLIGLVAAGLLGIVAVAGVIISLRTKDGTLIVEVNQPDALIQVLSEEGKVAISEPGGLKPISISVVPGKHRIRVEKDGFATIADNIEIESGGKLDIKARLVPNAGKGPVASGRGPAKPWDTPAFQAWMKTVATMPAEKQIEAVSKKLMELNPGFDGKITGLFGKETPTIRNGVVTAMAFVTNSVTDISPLRALVGLNELDCSGREGKSKLVDLSPLQGMSLSILLFADTEVSDLSVLRGMQLTQLRCPGTKISDLTPLQGMPLNILLCYNTEVSDLSPLRGMPLKNLVVSYTGVSDLSPLEGMPLEDFWCYSSKVSDLSSLREMKLVEVAITPAHIAKGMDILRQMKSLKTVRIGSIGNVQFAPAEFWKKYDAGEFGKPAQQAAGGGQQAAKPKLAYLDPAFQQWVKATQALPAEQQIEAVSKMLRELNPGFDGKVVGYAETGTPKIDRGMVTEFGFLTNNVTDISPVRALVGLKALNCGGSGIGNGKLSDLSPLEGMRLGFLTFNSTKAYDLSPLKAIPLIQLYCYNTPVSDLSPLEGCKGLVGLVATSTKVTPAAIAALQKALPNCKIEWDGAGKGPVTSGQGPAKPWETPEFQQWVKATQALPAEKQIEAVSKKLMELNPGFDGKMSGYDRKGTPRIEDGVVVSLDLISDKVTDISPVRALVGLRTLACVGSGSGKSELSDLSPLRGMKLTYLACGFTKISDLSPLAGMKLTHLFCYATPVSDLSLMQGMPLINLDCNSTEATDLSPIESCKSLRSLRINGTKLTAAQVAALQKALPNCKIEWDDPSKPKTPGPAASGSK